jgi:hypothetical protein
MARNPKTKADRTYTSPDGIVYPLIEAPYDRSWVVYKSDRRKAIIGDPWGCLIALGGKRQPDVQEVYIGSGGDAYVIHKPRKGKPAVALHYTIPAQAAKVRDAFDTKNAPSTQIIMLRAPTDGRTLDARAESNKARTAKIKNGTHTVKRRGTPAKKRIMTLGVAQRPRARITSFGVDTQPVAA